jgi:LmbE family N-acetylglucosaminyl deacetylase
MTEASVDLEPPQRALAVSAHPDDVDFGCGATLAKWAAAGTEVHLLVLTDGSKGTWDADADTAALVATRREEQRESAKLLGLEEVHFLDFVDGELANTREEQAAVCAVIRSTRPDVVFAHDPWKRYRLHPDHRHAGYLTIDALVAARDPHFFAGHGEPHRPARLLLFEAQDVDHVEDATGWLGTKVDALLCHRSQWRSTMDIEPGGPSEEGQRAAFATRIRTEAGEAGTTAGIALGEGFKRIEPV